MVAFHYPPEASSSGVLRTLKYTRYLEQFGWRCTVISTDVSAYEQTNDELAKQIPGSVRVIRTRYINTKRHLSIAGRYPAFMAVPDNWIGWWPWGVAAGKRVLKHDPPDIVYSTSPHPTAHLIAMRIAALGKLPFVADFRDPWHEEPPEPGTPGIVARGAKILERRVVRRADRVVASTLGLRDLMQQRYGDQPKDKFSAILNGYDEQDFESIARPDSHHDELVMVHAGNINREFRDPCSLFRAIANVAKKLNIGIENIRLRFIGGGAYGESPGLQQCVKDTGLHAQVDFVSRLPYKETLEALSSADILLLLQASEDTRDLVPAKLYEYLRTKRPVLALVFDGATSEVMRETGGGWCVDPRRTPDLESAVEHAICEWRAGKLDQHSADQIALKKFDRRSLAGELADVFNDVVGARS